MGKIKKILENELVGGTQSTDVYPVTSTKAVYNEDNERLDNILKSSKEKIEELGVKGVFDADLVQNTDNTYIFRNTGKVRGNLIVRVLENTTDLTSVHLAAVGVEGGPIYSIIKITNTLNLFRLDQHPEIDYIDFIYVHSISETNKGHLNLDIYIGPAYTADDITNFKIDDLYRESKKLDTTCNKVVFTNNSIFNSFIKELNLNDDYVPTYSIRYYNSNNKENHTLEFRREGIGNQYPVVASCRIDAQGGVFTINEFNGSGVSGKIAINKIPEELLNLSDYSPLDSSIFNFDSEINSPYIELQKTNDSLADTNKGLTETNKKVKENSDKIGTLIENTEYIKVITDINGAFLLGIRRNGEVEWSRGIPSPIKKELSLLREEFLKGASIPSMTSSSFTEDINLLKSKTIPISRVQTNIIDKTIIVETQEAFNSIQQNLKQACDDGYSGIAIVLRGEFEFKEKHLVLDSSWNYPNTSIYILGDGATISSLGTVYSHSNAQITNNGFVASREGRVNFSSAFIDENKENIDFINQYKFSETDSLIEVVDEKTFLFKLKLKPTDVDREYSEDECTNIGLMHTKGYYAYIGNIQKIVQENGSFYVYFYSESWEPERINIDYTGYSGKRRYPRYKFINLPNKGLINIKDNEICIGFRNSVKECKNEQFLNVTNPSIKSLSISGIKFKGNSNNNKNGLIKCDGLDNLSIYDCEFSSIMGIVIRLYDCSNSEIFKCNFYNCYTDQIHLLQSCLNSYIHHNKFRNCGLIRKQNFCVIATSQDFVISHNDFLDFGYSAIDSGIHSNYYKEGMVCSGIIEYNKIHYSKEWFADYRENTFYDTGALHFIGISNGTIVRYNLVYDYIQMGTIFAVYFDVAAGGVSVYGNIIIDIYAGVGEPKSFYIAPTFSDNNDIQGKNCLFINNIVSTNYSYFGNPEHNGTNKFSRNVLLYRKNQYYPKVTNGLFDGDLQYEYISSRDGYIFLSGEAYSQIEKMGLPEFIMGNICIIK